MHTRAASPGERIVFHPDDPVRDVELLGLSSESLWPISVTVHLTDRCNHSCNWCWFSRSDAELEISKVIDTLSDFVAMGAREIIVSGGGEPLLHPDVDNLLYYLVSQHRVHRRLYTNGSLLNRHRLVEDAFDYVRVSLDAGGEELHSRLHGTCRGSYRRILASLSEMAARKRSLLVGVSVVVTTFNIDSLKQLTQDCRSFSVSYALFKPLMRGLIRESAPVVPETEPGMSVFARCPLSASTQTLPSLPEAFASKCLTIAPDSCVYPCCHLSGDKYLISQIGDVSERIGSKRHRAALRSYAGAPHSCRIHDLWTSSLYGEKVAPL